MSLFKREERKSQDTATYSANEDSYLNQLVDHYKTRLLQEANLEHLTNLSQREMRLAIERFITQFMNEEKVIVTRHKKEQLLTRIIDESVGFGPLESLLKDDTITEILINGPDHVSIEKNGRLQQINLTFRNEEHLRHIIDRIVAPIGRRIDESSPMVDARLADGSRVNAVIPPVSLNGTLLSIRKFRKEPFTLDDLIQGSSMTEDMRTFLTALIRSKINTVISGGTGSGKTTLLNALAQAIPEGERVITIEDSAELNLNRGDVVGMEARPPNVEGRGEITIRQLVKNALRMRPDRIIVGEVRGAEAFDMLQAMNTGHEGSLTTVHANSARDALSRIEGMVIMAGMDLPSTVIREYIAGAVEIIIQGMRLSDGRRLITAISEVAEQDGRMVIHDIFTFERTGVSEEGRVLGEHRPTGYVPAVLDRLNRFGQKIEPTLFETKEEVT
ncbi:CpaF family protein [Paenalkalicoccus suaedae]|uniref:CpaF family protein n=1 Tax=Paenalkalicoccus suaedae TaxID=2592382 RepID=A0A859FIE4_9BACI|nr:CpaF family protein [Paenalkalicoccus suaedae]QKS72484.1 CpaF family protein [Paenalkalicoccus suaedae]